DGVSFYLKEHETLGLVGESGCGKTTIGRTILRLTPATSGRIVFDGHDITAMSARELRPLRRRMQMIFQDLDAALNPKMRVRDLQRQLGLSYLFISHDLEVVQLVSHKVAVMYLGKIVEMGLADRIAGAACHPYTQILWSALVDKKGAEASRVLPTTRKGAWGVFDFERPAHGCRFAPRCPVYEANGRPAVCTDAASEPELRDLGGGHYVAYHFPRW